MDAIINNKIKSNNYQPKLIVSHKRALSDSQAEEGDQNLGIAFSGSPESGLKTVRALEGATFDWELVEDGQIVQIFLYIGGSLIITRGTKKKITYQLSEDETKKQFEMSLVTEYQDQIKEKIAALPFYEGVEEFTIEEYDRLPVFKGFSVGGGNSNNHDQLDHYRGKWDYFNGSPRY